MRSANGVNATKHHRPRARPTPSKHGEPNIGRLRFDAVSERRRELRTLCSGVPVLISQSTPWRNLESWGLGWDLPLNDELGYVRIIEMLAGEDASQRAVRRDGIKRNIGRYMDLPARIEQHASIFRLAVASKNRTFQQAV
jgi:hypothetical protein